jgi:1-acyl-sn-glycerol-3-phosphate acyltransferase
MAYWVFKLILTPVFFFMWRVKIEGRENVPRDGAAVLAANHQSFCDSFFLPLVVRRKLTFLAKAEYFDSKRTAWFFRAAGQIPIRRGGGSASERALATACEVLARGNLIGLYPEGTRSVDEYVHKGRTGVARISRECGVPVVPVGIVGTVDVQPVDSNVMRPFRTVTIRFGAPMQMAPMSDPSDYTVGHDHVQCRKFTDDLMHEISRLSGRTYVDSYVPKRTRRDAVDGTGAGDAGGDGTEGAATAPTS